MSASPPRDFRRVSSRINEQYAYDESGGNIEAVLELSASHDETVRSRWTSRRSRDDGDEQLLHPSSPYRLRRIFSNPPAPRRSSIETSLLHSDVEERVVHEPQEKTKSKPYGMRRIFSNPHSHDVETCVPLTKTKSYHYPSKYDKKVPGSPVSLVRRVSRLRQQKEKLEDDETVDESLESSATYSAKSVRKSKTKWVLLVTFLGLVGAGGYMGYTYLSGDKKKPIHTQSLQSFGGGESSKCIINCIMMMCELCSAFFSR